MSPVRYIHTDHGSRCYIGLPPLTKLHRLHHGPPGIALIAAGLTALGVGIGLVLDDRSDARRWWPDFVTDVLP